MKKWLLVLVVCSSVTNVYAANSAKTVSADNSAMNERIVDANGLTAENQSNLPADVEVTRRIREELMKDETLSTYAKNVKIIAVNKAVTLKGPVNTATERQKIVNIASNIAPKMKIYNQMSIVK